MKPNGGPAFGTRTTTRRCKDYSAAPSGMSFNPDTLPDIETTETIGGMSLRDYFAAAALQGAIANEVLIPSAESEFSHLAMRLYQMADAMLAEREKP